MSRYRGKLGQLPHEVQLEVAYALMEGVEYDEIRAMLRSDGFGEAFVPANNRAWRSFMRSDLYQKAQDAAIRLSQRAKLKSSLTAELMENGGLDRLAAAGNAHALVEAMDAYERGELAPDELSRIVARNGRTLAGITKNQLAQELAEFERQLKQPDGKEKADPATVMAKLRAKLGMPQPEAQP